MQSSTFNNIIYTVAEIHAVFGRAVGTEKLQECQIITSYRGMSALELSNCYFTPHKDMAEGSELVLSTDIDPYGYLAKAAGTTLCYTEENAVLYFERQGSNDDNYKFSDSDHKEIYDSCTFQHRYTPVKPVIFGVGDIVEVQASFMAVPLKQGKFKTTMVLRGITLIDGTFTQVQKRILSDKRTYQTNSLLAIKNSSSDYYQTERNSSNHTKAKSWLPGRRIIRDQSQNESHGSRYTTFTTAKGKP